MAIAVLLNRTPNLEGDSKDIWCVPCWKHRQMKELCWERYIVKDISAHVVYDCVQRRAMSEYIVFCSHTKKRQHE